MNTQAFFLEFLVSGFFAIACFKARGTADHIVRSPRDLLRLTDRVERLRRSRWQWFAMVLLVVMVRLQNGQPLMIEVTVAIQLAVFLALPTQKSAKSPITVRGARQESLVGLSQKQASSGKA